MGTRNQYTKEFKEGAVRLVLEQGRKASDVARSLGLKPNSVQKWVQQARVDRGEGRPEQLTTDEKAELTSLRRRVKELETEKVILKNYRAFAGDLLDQKLPSATVASTEGSGRQLFGDVEPDKKHGPGMVADLRVVTPVRRSRLGK